MRSARRLSFALRDWRRLGLGVALAAATCLSALGADLQVSPISLQFAPSEQAQGIWLSNSGTQLLRAQIRVQRWFQQQESDQLEPARDLVASPPAVEIAPGQRQLVRIVRPQASPAAQERSYRVIVDELPHTASAQPGTAPAQGLQFLLRHSIPVFIAPEAPVTPRSQLTNASQLGVQLTAGGAGPELTIANTGPRRIRISALVHEDARGHRTTIVPGLLGYVLAGQRMRWALRPPEGAGPLLPGALKAKLDDDPQEQSLPVAGRPS